MPYSEVSWAYKDPATTQKLGQMAENPSWVNEHHICGLELDITGTSTVEIKPGRLSLEGKWISETATANLILTAETNAHWREGATQETSSTAWYVYAYNSSSSIAIKFCLSAPAYSDTSSATSRGPKLYDKSGSTWFRGIAVVWNNSGNALVPILSSILG